MLYYNLLSERKTPLMERFTLINVITVLSVTSTIILTVGSVVARFWGCGGLTVTGTQPAYRQP